MMKLTFLGTGTSDGVPLLGCHCSVCLSNDPRDKRLRTALYLQDGSHALLLDAGPDLRYQALRSSITHFDAVLISHQHADHTGGLAEMRRFNQLMGNRTINLYANESTVNDLTIKYNYFFNPAQKGGGIPQMLFHVVTKPFDVGPFHIVPIPIKHGNLDIFGYRINDFAFITDASFISKESYSLLEGVNSLVLNALRYNSHGTHFSIDQACEAAKKINAKQSYFIHFTHDISHQEASSLLPSSIFLAYDGLVVTL